MNNELENILSNIQQKEASVLCREVTSIGDTMDVLRAKWNVEILTAILCGQTRFKDIQEAVHGVSEKVLTWTNWQASDRTNGHYKSTSFSYFLTINVQFIFIPIVGKILWLLFGWCAFCSYFCGEM